MITSKTIVTATAVERLYVNWTNEVEFTLANGDEIRVPLSLDHMKELRRELDDRIESLEQRRLKELREQLEKSDATNTLD